MARLRSLKKRDAMKHQEGERGGDIGKKTRYLSKFFF
jgi:hypothetical protein